MTMMPLFLNSAQVEIYFNISADMLARYSGKGAQDAYSKGETTVPPLPVTRVGKANLYDAATLREWLLKYHTTGAQN